MEKKIIKNQSIKKNFCEEFKKDFFICMKNSEDNIIVCQEFRDVYENCLRKENKKENKKRK